MKHQADVPSGKARRRTPKIAPLIALTIVFAIIPLYHHPSIWYYYSTNELSSSEDEIVPQTNTLSQNINKFLESNAINADVIIQENDHHHNDDDDHEEKHPFHDNRDLRKKDKGEKRRAKHREKAHKTPRKNGKRQNSGHGERDQHILELPKKNNININVEEEEECDLFRGEWVENPEGPYYTNRTCWAIQEHQNCMKFGRPDTGFMKWKWKPDGCDLPVFDPLEFLNYMRGKSLAFVGDSVARNHMQSLICLLSRVCTYVTTLLLIS